MTESSTCAIEPRSATTRVGPQSLRMLGARGVAVPAVSRLIRRGLLQRLADLQGGVIHFHDPELSDTLGQPGADGLSARLDVTDAQFYRHLALGGSLGFAEAYLGGDWVTDDLTALLRIFARNLQQLDGFNLGLSRIGRGVANLSHKLARNTRSGSRRNIASHYDLSNEFFESFLDPTMMYSSALFEEESMTLEQASIAKLEAVCRRLQLQPGDRVIEIGTGWGGFAVHAAQNYGCHVTTTTISRQQYDYARERIAAAGLADRITLLNDDYRDLRGQYDKLVSIEMLEAVGHQYYDTYFGACDRLLKRGGRMVVQTITMPEQRYAAYCRSVDFIQKYIFPGGSLPSLAAVQQAVGKTTDLRLVEQSDFGLSYARTLEEWRQRFFDRLDEVRRLVFDERFVRMWEYYLCYCEAAFLERAVGVSQLVWVKPGGAEQ
jgi:cyclopropane-fatty-acyl-phospholipid synthase